jgi:hypothetical protein
MTALVISQSIRPMRSCAAELRIGTSNQIIVKTVVLLRFHVLELRVMMLSRIV